jgi:hypothetical protein
MKIEDVKQGQTIQFHAVRIFKGNPIQGVLQWQDEEWIDVTLLNDIEGMVTSWEAGENKKFRKELIKFEKIL